MQNMSDLSFFSAPGSNVQTYASTFWLQNLRRNGAALGTAARSAAPVRVGQLPGSARAPAGLRRGGLAAGSCEAARCTAAVRDSSGSPAGR